MKEFILRSIESVFVRFYFRSHSSKIKKPLAIRNYKYIHPKKGAYVFKNSRIECFNGEGCNPNFQIGNNVYIGYNFSALVTTDLIIGDDTLIASDCLFTTENHGVDPRGGVYRDQKLISKPISIGKNCWIGEKVIILPGCDIGDNVVVGAGSIVTKSIPSNSMAVGNPAKVIKKFNYDSEQWENIL